MIEVPLSRYFGLGKALGITGIVLREYNLDENPLYPYIEDRHYRSKEISWDFDFEGMKFSRVLLAHNSLSVFLFEGSYDHIFHPYISYVYRIYTIPRDKIADHRLTSIVYDGPEDLEVMFKLAHG